MRRYFPAAILILAITTACATPTLLPPTPTTPATATPTSTKPAPTAAAARTPTTPSGETEIEENDNSKTITLQTGAKLQLILHSTYWQIQGSSDSQILRQLGEPVIAPDVQGRISGLGAGTITVEFQAIAAGQANVAASRTTCGEALRCSGGQATFQVVVIVR